MTEDAPSKPRRSRWRLLAYAMAATLVLFAALVGGLVWYANTPKFAAHIRQTVVNLLERSTGGRVEMGGFHWSMRHFAIEVDDLTIQGKEAAGDVPYFHVQRLLLRASILSFLSPKIRLTSLTADRPTIHVIVYPDGTTNQPRPRVSSTHPLSETLLSMAIGHTRVEDGMVLLNDRKIPWEMAAGPIQVTMQYLAHQSEYQATLDTRNITFQLKNSAEAHSRLRVRLGMGSKLVRIESLDLETGNSHLMASGELRNFSAPAWRVDVHGSIDARQVGAMTGVDGLRSGTAKLAIAAHGVADGTFQVGGHVDLRSATWEVPWLRLHNVDLSTNLSVDNDTCSLTDFSSVLEDHGRIAGSMVLKHCVGPSQSVIGPAAPRDHRPSETLRQRISPQELLERLHRKFGRETAKPVQREYQPLQADIEARISDVTLPLILAATAPKSDWNIGFTTAASGKVTVHWIADGHGLDVHGDLMLSVPQHTLGLVPVSGPAHADYLGDHRHLVIQDANLHTPGTQVRASGTLDLLEQDLHSNLRLDVVGRDLSEFDQLLTVTDLRAAPARAPHALPLKLLDSATFHGVVHGSFFALQAVGHLASGPFEMVVERTKPQSGGEMGPEHLLIWDQFQGDIDYAPSRLNLLNAELVRGNTLIHTDLHLLPERTGAATYTYNQQTQITATVQSANMSVADLQSVVGTSYPIAGTVEAHAHVAGIVDDLEGSGHVMLTHGVFAGQQISSVFIDLAAQGNLLQATHIRLTTAGGVATGQLTYNDASDALQGDLTGQNFALEKIAPLKNKRLAVGGVMGFHLQGGGPLRSPTAAGNVQIERLTLNGQSMGRLHANTRYQSGTLYLTSRAEMLKTHMDIGGQVQLSGKYPAQMQLTFTDFNVDPLLRMMIPSGLAGQSSVEGKLIMSGPLAEPAAIQADADLSLFTATIGKLPVHSQGPMEASLREGKLQLKRVHIQGQDMDLTGSGTIDFKKNDALRMHSEGTVNARLASVLDKTIESSGEVRFVLNAGGTIHRPDLQGRAQLNHINMHVQNITNGLTDLSGEMVFDQDRLVVQQLKGSSGGGQLDVKGFVGYQNGIFADMTVTAQDVRIRYPKGISSSVDAKQRLLGNFNSLLVSGNVQLMRFGMDSNVDLASLATSGPGVSAPIDPFSPLNRIHLDIHVTSASDLGFQNSLASLAGDVNLRIRGTVENPSVLGRIDITQGSASFAGTKYNLQQGDILFNNPVTISPEIDLEATARVQNYDIIITLHGPPSKLDISYRSEPPLTQPDVLALLALGRTNEQAAMYGEQQQAGANLTTEALLGGALNAAVSSRVQKLFGVGSVRVDPNFVGTLGESTARITVEQQVGRDLILTFATNVNTTAQQLIQGQFNLTRNVSIIAVRDEANVFSMYLQIRGRHK